MTAFDFPSSPTYGQTYQAYTWDGVKWYSTLGGTGDAAPSPPAILTGLIGWWDASVFASITFNTGNNVNAWADQSGNNNNMAWAGFGRPIYGATAFNTSYPAMTLSATLVGNAFEKTSFPMGTGNTLTIFYVGTGPKSGEFNSAGRVMGYGPTSDDFSITGGFNLSAVTTQTDRIGMQRAFTQAVATGVSAYPAGHRFIVTVNSSGLMTIYVDGVSGGTATSAGNWVNGGTLAIGSQPAHNAGFWAGSISEIGIATGFSSSTVVGQLDTYLKNKWGL